MKKILFMFVYICLLSSGCRSDAIETAIAYRNVDDINEEAIKLYDDGDFVASLTKYSEAIRENPTDIDAMIGVVQCQIALENYSMASINLSAAIKVDPTDHRIYDLYVQMSEKSENIDYARTAVTLAQTYNVTDFLNKVPDVPEINHSDGSYDSKFEVEISASTGSEVYVTEKKGNSYISYKYYEPVTITRGNTDLEVYCVVEGIPSDIITAKYVCDYPPAEVSFVDPIIEQLVRMNLGKESGAITDVDCEGITRIRQYDFRNNGMSWNEYKEIRVNSLNDMKLFPNLQELYLDNLEGVSDFSALASCKNLSSIDFSDSDIQNISFVEYLPSLGYCKLSNNEISDLSPLTSCKNLYGLYVDSNPIDDLGVLRDLDLEYISVSATYVDDLLVFDNWEKLTYLALYGCGGRDLSPIGKLINLESLYLYAWDYGQGNWNDEPLSIGDISFLEYLTKLKRLYLDGLSDYLQLEVVKSLTNLTNLSIQIIDSSSIPNNVRQELQNALPKCSIQ